MSMSDHTKGAACGGGCAHCAIGQEHGPNTGPAGWRLVLPVIGVFLFPLMMALAGAVLFRETQTGQTAGAFSGLLIGLISAILVRRLATEKEMKLS